MNDGREELAGPVDIVVLEANRRVAEKIRRALDPLLNRVHVFHEADPARRHLIGRAQDGGPGTPALLVLDVDGMEDACWTFVRELRGMDEFRDTEIVVTATNPGFHSLQAAKDAGVDRFESKPINMNRIAQMVAHHANLHPAIVRRVLQPPASEP